MGSNPPCRAMPSLLQPSMFTDAPMNIPSQSIIYVNAVISVDLVLLEPERSADPPMVSVIIGLSHLILSLDLVLRLWADLKLLFF